MTYRVVPLILAVFLFMLSPLAEAGDQARHGDALPGGQLPLSPGVMELLNREMGAIQDGVMGLVPAIASGDWDKVAEIGKKIKASYILKQELTAAQKEELHRVLPADFIEKDQSFHTFCGMLAHAAEMKNADVVTFYFYKLNEACVACHAKYAPKRFPALAETRGQGEH